MARRQVNIYLNGRQAGETIRDLYKERRRLTREVEAGTLAEEDYIQAVKRIRSINQTITEHRRMLRGVETSWDKLKKAGGQFIGVATAAFTADAIVQFGRELFRTATEMDALERKARVVLGETLPQVTAAAEENAAAMGLTTSEYVAATTALADLLIPMQFSRQEAATMSTELVNLSGALSEWTGGQRTAAEVSNILSKAMLGEREELKSLGIAISEEDVKNRLRKKGLEDLTGEYLQQAKAIATVELITEKSIDAQTAYAENSDSLIRRQAELNAKLADLRERLAVALIPVFERLVAIADSVVDGFGGIADAVTSIVDPAQAATDAFRDQTTAVDSLERDFVPLLDRYDELINKSDKSKAEQDELEQIIKQIGKTVPSAITAFNDYGEALGINAERAREFVEAQQALLSVKNQEAIEDQEKALSNLEREAEKYRQTLEGTGIGLTGIIKRGEEFFRLSGNLGGVNEIRLTENQVGELFETFGNLNRRITGTKALLAELRGEPIVENLTQDPAPTSTADSGSDQAAAAAAERRRKAAEKEAEALEKQQQRLLELVEKYNEERRLSELSEDERRLEEIRIRYDKEIALAQDLEAKGVEAATQSRLRLEELRDEELAAARREMAEARLQEELDFQEEAEARRLEKEAQLREERAAAEQEISEALREAVLSEQERALLELEEQYERLLELARQYGIDTLDIEIAYRREKEELRREFQEREKKETFEASQKQAEALAKAYGAMATAIGNALEFVLGESAEATAAGKIFTLVQIGLKTAEALASATASAAGIPFPANLPAIATAVGTVLANMAQAKRVLNETPDVPQRVEGGFVGVRGQDDGRLYNARYIGQTVTGMLPPGPVLVDTTAGPVLANERGQEYFVSNTDLADPRVFSYVQAIDNIRRARQFVDGGFTVPVTTSGPSTSSTALPDEIVAMMADMRTLLSLLLEQGVVARIDDDTIIDLRQRQAQLTDASGGAV